MVCVFGMLAYIRQGLKMLIIKEGQKKKQPVPVETGDGLQKEGFRQRPTLPHSFPCSTIGAEELNFRVRDGNGCCLFAIATEKAFMQTSAQFGMSNYVLDIYVSYFVAKPHD